MARINIEDSVFKEDRFIKLCIAAGGRITGIGALSCLWIEAQKFYLTHGEIPNDAWLNADLPEYLITTRWAERTLTGVRAVGQDDAFKWLRQAQAAGSASAKARAEKHGTSQPPSTAVRENSERPSTARQPLTLTLPLTPSLSLSLSKKESSPETESSPPKPPTPNDHGAWRCLLSVYNANRGSLPEAKAWNKEREKKAQARWKELPDQNQWVEVVKHFAGSAFHTGTNDRGWIADFGFILQQGRWLEAAEKSGVPVNRVSARESQNKNAFAEARRMMEASDEN